jgi:antitoxin component YwqK of YwqJK toxin-antitoxin module
MKKSILTTGLILLFSICAFSQKLTLSDLANLCDKKNWEDVNQGLMNRNWTFYDSEKGDDYNYNVITWTFNKDYYEDKAQGWFHLYTYEEAPNKVSYVIFNKESYSLIQKSISTAGFKLIESNIENNEVVSTYSNPKYTLTIRTERREEDEYTDITTIEYNIILIKKYGIYDDDNGAKTEYYDDGTLKMKYNLVNGVINGEFSTYNEDGKLEKTGVLKNGVSNGTFKEYNESGEIEKEYAKLNDNLNGTYKEYENGKLSYVCNYVNGIENGPYNVYIYSETTNELLVKIYGEYVSGKKNGLKKVVTTENGKEKIVEFENYTNGYKNGSFQHYNSDTVTVGFYKNDLLDGEYSEYLDVNRYLFGGDINTNISELVLLSKGNYYKGNRYGHWQEFDATNTLRLEGYYDENGLRNGEWRYYYSNYEDSLGKKYPYSGKLFLIENYSNDMLNGKSTRYSNLYDNYFPCSEIDPTKSFLDTCSTKVFEKTLETSFYKNDNLDGPFEIKDSLNRVLVVGNFSNGLRNGEWIIKSKKNNGITKGNYSLDKREGEWIDYSENGDVLLIYNYSKGLLNGEYISYNDFKRPSIFKNFKNSKLTDLTVYDSLGLSKILKYSISSENDKNYRCLKTNYFENGYYTQEYFVTKDEDVIDHNWFIYDFEESIDEESGSKKGYKDGEFNLYNTKDQILINGSLFHENRKGLWSYFYYDQNVKMECYYTDGISGKEAYFDLSGSIYSGEFTYIDEENNTKEIRKIKEGVRNGKTTYIDLKTNKTIKKEKYSYGILD